jgi:hypothetical protein
MHTAALARNREQTSPLHRRPIPTLLNKNSAHDGNQKVFATHIRFTDARHRRRCRRQRTLNTMKESSAPRRVNRAFRRRIGTTLDAKIAAVNLAR